MVHRERLRHHNVDMLFESQRRLARLLTGRVASVRQRVLCIFGSSRTPPQLVPPKRDKSCKRRNIVRLIDTNVPHCCLVRCQSTNTTPSLTFTYKMSGVPENSESGTLHELESSVAGRKRTVGDSGNQPLEVPRAARTFTMHGKDKLVSSFECREGWECTFGKQYLRKLPKPRYYFMQKSSVLPRPSCPTASYGVCTLSAT